MFKLTFRTDNAAFDGDNLTQEIARVLRNVATRIEALDTTSPDINTLQIRDLNGNQIGSVVFTWE